MSSNSVCNRTRDYRLNLTHSVLLLVCELVVKAPLFEAINVSPPEWFFVVFQFSCIGVFTSWEPTSNKYNMYILCSKTSQNHN